MSSRLSFVGPVLAALLLAACGTGTIPDPVGGTPDAGTLPGQPDAGSGPDAGTGTLKPRYYDPQGTGRLAGAVTVPAGHTTKGMLLIACYEQGDDCDPARSAAQLLTQDGTSASFSLTGLAPTDKFLVIAWKDLNGNNQADSGDLIGMYNVSAQKTYVTPDRADLAITTAVYDPIPAGELRGTLTLPAGQDVYGTLVEVCPVAAMGPTGCDPAQVRAYSIGATGTNTLYYALQGVPAGSLYVRAFKDLTNSPNSMDPGDLYGVHTLDQASLTPVVAPSAGVDLTLRAVPQPPAPKGSVPSELVGTWTYVVTGTADYYSEGTGAWAPPSGMSKILELRADGTFSQTSLTQVSLYSCTTSMTDSYEGTATAANGRLVLAMTKWRHTYKSNCQPSLDSDGYVKPETWGLGYRMANGGLQIIAPDGSTWDYHRG